MIIADTSAVVALIDADDRHHATVRSIYERDPGAWLLPWSILAEVDYLLATHVGRKAEETFLADLGSGAWGVAWGEETDLVRANELARKYRALDLGLVDGTVAALSERLGAEAIATLDLRHFGVMSLRGRPALLPRDSS